MKRRKGAPPSASAWARALVLAALSASLPARAQEIPAATAPVPAELLARAAAPEPATRIAALGSLRALATAPAFQLALVMMQRDLDPRVRATAALALGVSHDPDFGAALAWAAVADPDPAVRAAAAASRAAVAPFAKRPRAAAGFSVLCPGCGYFYLGDSPRAVAYLGAASALIASGFVVIDHSPLALDGTHVVHDSGRGTPLLMAAQNLWFYGIFAAYRDARIARGDLDARYPVAREDLPQLLAAPFNPRVLKSPWVWLGLPAMLGAAVGASYLISRVEAIRPALAMRTLADGGGVQFFGSHYGTAAGFGLGEAYNVSLYLPVGVGEEALFRGAVQAGLGETSLGLWGGWAVASALFGAAHTFNFVGEENGVRTAALAVPYLMITGSYLGLVFIKADFSLRRSVALHFWYDFLLATMDFVSDPDHQPFVARFATSF